MVYTICYAFIFLAEILISLFYFENKFERKSSKKFLLFSVVIVYVLLYLSRLLNLTLVNLIAFFACNFFLLYFCSKSKLCSAYDTAYSSRMLEAGKTKRGIERE
jgi:uncharacterized membrane protein